MTRALAALAAVLALATPAAAAPVYYGDVEADAAYAGCVVTATGARWCLVAQRDASGVRLLVVSMDDLDVSATTTYAASALTPGTSLGRATLRLVVAGNPLLGAVDVTFTAEATTTGTVTNDGCVPLPLHVELVAASPTASLVSGTSGTVAGARVSGYDRCGAAMSTGPVRGLWRMAVA